MDFVRQVASCSEPIGFDLSQDAKVVEFTVHLDRHAARTENRHTVVVQNGPLRKQI